MRYVAIRLEISGLYAFLLFSIIKFDHFKLNSKKKKPIFRKTSLESFLWLNIQTIKSLAGQEEKQFH